MDKGEQIYIMPMRVATIFDLFKRNCSWLNMLFDSGIGLGVNCFMILVDRSRGICG